MSSSPEGSPASSGVVVTAVALSKSYPSGDQTLTVLSATDLQIRAGERVAVLGASGIGKSTLLHLLGGLDHPDSGSVSFRARLACRHGRAQRWRPTATRRSASFFSSSSCCRSSPRWRTS